jgi:hypothetical protein
MRPVAWPASCQVHGAPAAPIHAASLCRSPRNSTSPVTEGSLEATTRTSSARKATDVLAKVVLGRESVLAEVVQTPDVSSLAICSRIVRFGPSTATLASSILVGPSWHSPGENQPAA